MVWRGELSVFKAHLCGGKLGLGGLNARFGGGFLGVELRNLLHRQSARVFQRCGALGIGAGRSRACFGLRQRGLRGQHVCLHRFCRESRQQLTFAHHIAHIDANVNQLEPIDLSANARLLPSRDRAVGVQPQSHCATAGAHGGDAQRCLRGGGRSGRALSLRLRRKKANCRDGYCAECYESDSERFLIEDHDQVQMRVLGG